MLTFATPSYPIAFITKTFSAIKLKTFVKLTQRLIDF